MKNKNTYLITTLSFLILIIFIACDPKTQVIDGQNPDQERIDTLYNTYDDLFLEYLGNTNKSLNINVLQIEPLSEKYSVPKKVYISKQPYDFGFTIGDIARQYQFQIPTRNGSDDKLQNDIKKMYTRISPAYLEILRGIAEANDLTLSEIDLVDMEYDFFAVLWTRLLQYSVFYSLTDFGRYGDTAPGNNCSVASYYLKQKHLVGRNFDNPSDRPHYLLESKLDGAYKSVGHGIYSLYHWLVDGVNEKGLSINCATNLGAYNWQEPYPDKPAIFSGHMARLVIDNCASVDEAVDLIGSVRIWFPNEGLHWIISDKSGKSVVIEFDLNRKMVVLDRTDPWELITNTPLQEGEDYVLSQCHRYRTAKPILENGVSDKSDMLDVMKSMRVQSGGSRTLWTVITNLNNLTVDIYYRKEYEKKYTFSF